MQNFDLIIIGGGPAGYVGAIRAGQLGLNTAIIEKRKTLGGTCLNVGCIPSKALLESSEHYYQAKTKFSKHGVMIGDLKLDLETMMKRKDTVVRQLTQGIAGLMKKHKVTHFNAFGKVLTREGNLNRVEIKKEDGTTEILSAARIMLATGSEAAELPFMKFDGKNILSSTEALEITKVPEHLVVVGGGVIGLELGSVWARLGSKVTVIEFSNQFLAAMDQQCAKELFKSLNKQGLEFKLGHKCLGATVTGDKITLSAEELSSGNKISIVCDKVLVSTGRRAYTTGLGLENIGITPDKLGRVEINEHFETSAAGVYAVGDLVDGPMLAHKAEEEGVAAVEMMAGIPGHVNYEAIPSVIYTWPEFASVGYTEEEVKASGIEYTVGSFPFLANGRAKSMDENEGLAKIITETKTDRVIGAHIVGARAADLLAEIVTTMEFGGSSEDIARTCHSHPSLSEVVKEAALAVDKRSRSI